MQSVSLSSRKCGNFFVLVASSKVKTTQISPRVYLSSSHHNQFLSVREIFPNGFFRVNIFVGLVNVSNFYGISDQKLSFIGSFFSHNHSENSCFPCSVWSNNSYNSCLRQFEIQVFIKQFISISFCYSDCLNYVRSQTWSIRNIQL